MIVRNFVEDESDTEVSTQISYHWVQDIPEYTWGPFTSGGKGWKSYKWLNITQPRKASMLITIDFTG